jgi:hypothetical protein
MMRIYRTDRDGIEVLRISGVVGKEEADMIASHLFSVDKGPEKCCILDFSGVRHVESKVFKILSEISSHNAGVIFSGLSEYLLDILVFTSDTQITPVFSSWRKAFKYLMAERGKLGVYAAVGAAGNK